MIRIKNSQDSRDENKSHDKKKMISPLLLYLLQNQIRDVEKKK